MRFYGIDLGLLQLKKSSRTFPNRYLHFPVSLEEYLSIRFEIYIPYLYSSRRRKIYIKPRIIRSKGMKFYRIRDMMCMALPRDHHRVSVGKEEGRTCCANIDSGTVFINPNTGFRISIFFDFFPPFSTRRKRHRKKYINLCNIPSYNFYFFFLFSSYRCKKETSGIRVPPIYERLERLWLKN